MFYRSGQFNFAKIGVPALYLRSGTDFIGREPGWGRVQLVDYETNRYHQPSDEYDESWIFGCPARVRADPARRVA